MNTHLRTILILAFTILFASGGCSSMEEYDYYTLDFPEYNDLLRDMNIPLTPIDYSPREDALYSAMEKESVNQHPDAEVPSPGEAVESHNIDAVPRATAEMRTTPPSNGREYREIAEPQPSSEDEAAMAEYDSEGGYQVASVDPEAAGVTDETVVEETVVEETTEPATDYYEEVETSEPEVTDTKVKVRDENGRPVVETVVTTRTTTVTRSSSPDYYEEESTVIEPEASFDNEESMVGETESAVEPLPEPVEETAVADVSVGESDLSDSADEVIVEEEYASEPAPVEKQAPRPAVPAGLDDL